MLSDKTLGIVRLLLLATTFIACGGPLEEQSRSEGEQQSQDLEAITAASWKEVEWVPRSQVLGDGSGVHTHPLLTGDVNGDGLTDLLFIGQDWSGPGLNIRVKLSNGDGTWTSRSQVLGDGSGVHTYPARVGDVNGDGLTDLIFVGQGWNGPGLNVRVKLSNGDGTWTSRSQVLGDGSGVHENSSHAADVNGDGRTDIIFVGQGWSGTGLNVRTKLSQVPATACALNGRVYDIPVDTQQFPRLSEQKPVQVLSLPQLDVSARPYTDGFPGVPNRTEWFAIRFIGSFSIPTAGSYRFRLHSDDGSRLYIDDQLVVDNDGLHSPRSALGTVSLAAGTHHLRVDYYQGPREEIALQLFWTPPGGQETYWAPCDS